MKELQEAVNRVAKFLALRQIETLTKEELKKICKTEQADVLLAFGNDMPETAHFACRAYQEGLCRKVMFCGGVGHSTLILKEKMKAMPEYAKCDVSGAEGDIFAQIAEKLYQIPKEAILIENCSTNCSENGKFALNILREKQIPHQTMLLMQDPTMQYRSYVSAKGFLQEEEMLISYAPFVPEVDEALNLVQKEKGLWPKERFLSLLMGEIKRLRDDENGYGPKGKGFIEHVEIPLEVESAYKVMCKELAEYNTR